MKTFRRISMIPIPLAILATCLALPAPALAAAGDKSATSSEGIRKIYDALRKVELDGTRSMRVENFVIEKDITKITLVSGKLWVTKPWKEGERPSAGWFSGEATIQMTPPTKIEKAVFKKQMDKEALDEKYTHAFLRFSDDLYDRIKDKLTPDSPPGDDVFSGFRDRQKLLEGLEFNVEFPLINDFFTQGPRQPSFLFEFETVKDGWISFAYIPSRISPTEESSYFSHKRSGSIGDLQSFRLITTFHDKAEIDSGRDLGHEEKDTFWMRHYAGEIKVDKDGLLLSPKLDMEIESMVDGLNVLTMDFQSYYGDEAHSFKLDAVTDTGGKPLEYMHRNNQLLVVIPKPLKKGEKTKVHVEYTANYIRPDDPIGGALEDLPDELKGRLKTKLSPILQDYATFTLLNTYPWFPQSGFLRRHTLDWTVKVPTPFVPVASGVTKKRWTEEGYNCLQTVETVPIALSSVLFGRYKMVTDSSVRPTINIFTLDKQQKQAKRVLDEARAVVPAYEKWFGPFPFDELDIAQMGFFYGFGQAPPGLVQLTGEAFLEGGQLLDVADTLGGRGLDPSFVHAFIAHEIGHEWWGHAVSWANPNDQWLSESFTEYCSGLYVQSTIGQKAFDAKLKQWRERSSRSKDAGPIWLGGRLGGRHYQNQTYEKGPYVLHMLRLALQAQAVSNGGTAADGDTAFFNSLHNFVDKFKNQNATTYDFQNVVKSTTKIDMDWLFDQWFRGNHWMNLEFKYEVRPTEDGKFLLTAHIKQPDKENIKQMAMPLYIHFGKDKIITKMVFLNKEDYLYQVKLPQSPDKVSLNDNNDVLADIKYN